MKTKSNRAFMAKKKVFLLTAAVVMMTGCGFMQNTSSSNNAATTNQTTTQATTQTAAPVAQTNTSARTSGESAGAALQALYTQYKAAGKYELNMQNAYNTMTLIANCEGLKQNYKDTNYLTDFGKGLITGSLGLVSQNNVQMVTNSLVSMVANNETVQEGKNQIQNGVGTAAEYANTAAQYAGAVGTLLSAFGK
jgi:hypothetical protein